MMSCMALHRHSASRNGDQLQVLGLFRSSRGNGGNGMGKEVLLPGRRRSLHTKEEDGRLIRSTRGEASTYDRKTASDRLGNGHRFWLPGSEGRASSTGQLYVTACPLTEGVRMPVIMEI